MLRSALALALALAACGSSHAAMPDAAPPPPDASGPFTEATPSSTPVMMKVSGDVLANPVVQPIFFAVDDPSIVSQTNTFLAQLATSSYWPAIATEYGVGALTVRSAIITGETAPTTDTGLSSWIANHFNGQNGWPAAPDAQTIYAVFLPPNVTVTTQFGQSCESFGGYHDEATGPSSESIVFAIMPRCPGGIDLLTTVTSHELIEASTDPHIETAPAYAVLDAPHYIWGYTPGDEVGDMCEYLSSAPQQLVGAYYVQRIWSNASAAVGHDPCVPVPTTPYFGAMPVFTESLPIPSIFDGSTIMTQGVQVAMGTPQTIEVDVFSDQPTGEFNVHADDVASQLMGGQPELSFTWDRQAGRNGDKLHLTITRLQDGPGGGSELVLVTDDPEMNTVALWWGYVAN
ncbi:MAG TPA: hypothetical protein VMJ10_12010 [Kofleriaceae bacterium]|nr:hypothetical protein [Kofleriaceae bacterium]